MRAAMSQLQLSARAYHHILKLARTIADLAGSDEIQSAHLGGIAVSPEDHDVVVSGITKNQTAQALWFFVIDR